MYMSDVIFIYNENCFAYTKIVKNAYDNSVSTGNGIYIIRA